MLKPQTATLDTLPEINEGDNLKLITSLLYYNLELLSRSEIFTMQKQPEDQPVVLIDVVGLSFLLSDMSLLFKQIGLFLKDLKFDNPAQNYDFEQLMKLINDKFLNVKI